MHYSHTDPTSNKRQLHQFSGNNLFGVHAISAFCSNDVPDTQRNRIATELITKRSNHQPKSCNATQNACALGGFYRLIWTVLQLPQNNYVRPHQKRRI